LWKTCYFVAQLGDNNGIDQQPVLPLLLLYRCRRDGVLQRMPSLAMDISTALVEKQSRDDRLETCVFVSSDELFLVVSQFLLQTLICDLSSSKRGGGPS
jgi:hypothetical protein